MKTFKNGVKHLKTHLKVVNDFFFIFRFTAFPIARRIGHPYQNRTPPKRKKPRTSFTRIQVSSPFCVTVLSYINGKFVGCRIRKTISQTKVLSVG